MNNIIPASKLVGVLAQKSGISVSEAEKFVNAYFNSAIQLLSNGKDVVMPGIGSLILTGDSEMPVQFLPDTALASMVNAPFAAFEAVSLGKSSAKPTPPDAPSENNTTELTDNQMAADGSGENKKETPASTESETVTETSASHDEAVSSDSNTIPNMPAIPNSECPADMSEADNIPPAPNIQNNDTPDNPQYVKPPVFYVDSPTHNTSSQPGYTHNRTSGVRTHRHRSGISAGWVVLWVILAFLFGCFAGFIAGSASKGAFTFTINSDKQHSGIAGVEYPEDNDDEDTSEEILDEETFDTDSDTESEVSTNNDASDDSQTDNSADKSNGTTTADKTGTEKSADNRPVQYDTVTSTTFLTTLARRHYGKMEYWVYIYDANDLGNPNRIPPGTKVKIPYKDQLPLTGNEEADIAAAKKRAKEIYAPYEKKS